MGRSLCSYSETWDIMALKSREGLTVPVKVSKCAGSRGTGDVKGFVLDPTGAVTP